MYFQLLAHWTTLVVHARLFVPFNFEPNFQFYPMCFNCWMLNRKICDKFCDWLWLSFLICRHRQIGSFPFCRALNRCLLLYFEAIELSASLEKTSWMDDGDGFSHYELRVIENFNESHYVLKRTVKRTWPIYILTLVAVLIMGNNRL